MPHRPRSPRSKVQLEVALEERGRQVFAPTLDLSASGVLLGGDAAPEIGTPVRVVMSLPPSGVFVRLQGEVVRHAAERERAAFAVAFHAVDEFSRQLLRGFLGDASAS